MPAVEYEVDVVAEIVAYVIGGRRADPAETIGRRCGQPSAEPFQQLQRQGVRRHTDADGWKAPGHGVEDPRCARNEHCQRSRPTRVGQRRRRGRNRARPVSQLLGRGDVDDERVVDGSVFDREDPAHGNGIRRVGREAVDGLGGDGDQPTGAQHCECLIEVVHRGMASRNASAASMNPKASGVAKWSTLRSVRRVASGSASANG